MDADNSPAEDDGVRMGMPVPSPPPGGWLKSTWTFVDKTVFTDGMTLPGDPTRELLAVYRALNNNGVTMTPLLGTDGSSIVLWGTTTYHEMRTVTHGPCVQDQWLIDVEPGLGCTVLVVNREGG